MTDIITPGEEQKPDINKKFCKYCQQELKENLNKEVKVCQNCRSDQRTWVNFIKLSTSFTALIMVLIAISQVINTCSQVKLARQQFDETKQKRIEAQDVLKKAKHVFGLASTASFEMKLKASSILDNANNSVIKSNLVLKTAEKNAKYSKKVTDIAKNTVQNTINLVDRQLKDSNKRITKTEMDFENIKGNVQILEEKTSKEFNIIKRRNEITTLADKAISFGKKEDFLKLNDEWKENLNDQLLLSEILRVKSFYISGQRYEGANIRPGAPEMKGEDFPTFELIYKLNNSKDWRIRAKAAQILGNRREKITVFALLESILNDTCLDVIKTSLDSFKSLTGYKNDDVFDHLPDFKVSKWWEENKSRVEKELK